MSNDILAKIDEMLSGAAVTPPVDPEMKQSRTSLLLDAPRGLRSSGFSSSDLWSSHYVCEWQPIRYY